MRVVSNSEMRDLDMQAIEGFGIPSIVLMENAGARAAEIVAETYDEVGFESDILIFAGKGKNGGDALVVARHLQSMGKPIRLFLLHEVDVYQKEAGVNLSILLKEKVHPVVLDNVGTLEEYLASGPGPYLVVDGLLGTGFKGPLSGIYADVVDASNSLTHYAIALDVPRGGGGTTGQVVGNAGQANQTIAFGFAKLGHYIAPGALYRGELKVIDISLPASYRNEGKVRVVSAENVAPLLKRRDRYGHKNSFGHCLLIGGSKGKLGAISLSARACLRMGTGLVSAMTWLDCWESLMVKIDEEIMTKPLQFDAEFFLKQRQEIQNFSAVVIGPGLGVSEKAAVLLRDLIQYYKGPMLIDADGINLLSDPALRSELLSRTAPTVLTPHPGEMARMMGGTKEDVVRDPMGYVARAVDATNATVLLKGATTFIGTADGTVFLNDYPNDGMATAGSGDVLSGMIGGLLGQKMNVVEAVILGVYLHSLSGDFAAQKLGHRSMTASDIIANVADSFLQLREFRDQIVGSDKKRT